MAFIVFDAMAFSVSPPTPYWLEALKGTDENWQYRFPGKTYIWSTDFHPGPIPCSIDLFEEIGGAVHAEIDFYSIFDDRVRKRNLKVLHVSKHDELDTYA